MQNVTLIGFGAIGRTLFQRVAGQPGLRITHIVVPDEHAATARAHAGDAQVVPTVPEHTDLVLECAGHQALTEHVVPALARGIECAVLSHRPLSQPRPPQHFAEAPPPDQTPGAPRPGPPAIAAARIAGLDSVTYTGRKPPTGWRGTPAEDVVNLDTITEPTVILQDTAREAARLYPKNANVAATVSLAGLGLDHTQVRLIADPTVTENIHHIDVRGAFGEMQITMRGKPLPDNPKTSALTVLSALRFLHNRTSAVTI